MTLKEFVDILEQEGELLRVKAQVDSDQEITEIADRFMKEHGGGKALLFEKTGTVFPVLINGFGSTNRMALSLGAKNLDEPGKRIEALMKELTSPQDSLWNKLRMLPRLADLAKWMPKKQKKSGACQQIVDLDPNMNNLPVLKCWPHDGGPFITLPCVVTEDPDTGIRNVGMYRIQVFDKQLTGMHWHKHKTGERHYQAYKAQGKKMPIAIVLGGDPALTFAATAPLPDNIDEYILAGFLMNETVRLCKCVTNDLYVPSDADIIIEGYIDPEEDKILEGPFGDHTGFYSLEGMYPRLHVTAITHKKDAIYPATIVGIPPMEDAYIQRASERIFLAPMKLMVVPEIEDIDLPPAGVAHNLTVAKIKKEFPGQALKVANALWGAGQMMFNKTLVIVDDLPNIHNYKELAQFISHRIDPIKDISFAHGPADVLDHSAPAFTYGSKMVIDATHKMPEEIAIHQYITDAKEELDASDIENSLMQIEGVCKVNAKGLEQDICAVIVALDKEGRGDVEKMKRTILDTPQLKGVKIVALVDADVDVFDMDFVCWYISGNIDPKRDTQFYAETDCTSRILIDGTRKTQSQDNFQRDWPNPVVSSKEIIQKVDSRWKEYQLGEYISSPSLRFMPLTRGEGAIAQEKS